MTTVEKLTDANKGMWRIRTATSAYILDLDRRKGMRLPGAGIEQEGDEGYFVADLRQDNQWWSIVNIHNCRLGEYMVLATSGISKDTAVITIRRSTVVREIEQLEGE